MIRLDTHGQYFAMYMFSVITIIFCTLAGLRFPTRIYYDKSRDLFSIMGRNVLGGQAKWDVKPGHAREQREGGFRHVLSNTDIIDDAGRIVTRLRLSRGNFVMPWYYNHLVDTPDGRRRAEKIFDAYFDRRPEQEPGDDASEEEVAQRNAEKWEDMRRSQLWAVWIRKVSDFFYFRVCFLYLFRRKKNIRVNCTGSRRTEDSHEDQQPINWNRSTPFKVSNHQNRFTESRGNFSDSERSNANENVICSNWVRFEGFFLFASQWGGGEGVLQWTFFLPFQRTFSLPQKTLLERKTSVIQRVQSDEKESFEKNL